MNENERSIGEDFDEALQIVRELMTEDSTITISIHRPDVAALKSEVFEYELVDEGKPTAFMVARWKLGEVQINAFPRFTN